LLDILHGIARLKWKIKQQNKHPRNAQVKNRNQTHPINPKIVGHGLDFFSHNPNPSTALALQHFKWALSISIPFRLLQQSNSLD
jgi:hypothetical protein